MTSGLPPQHRGVIYRLVPGSQANARKLHSIAFGCRFAWNRILAESQEAYCRHCDTERFSEDTLLGLLYERPARPSVSFFSLGKAFTRLRQENDWLQALPYTVVRYALKRQADAWSQAFKGKRGLPKPRKWVSGFTLPQDVKTRTDAITGVTRIRVPKAGWMVLRRRGGNPYAGCKAKQATLRYDCGKWYCSVLYEVPGLALHDNGKAVGIDRNVGQITLSTGERIDLPEVSRLEARRKRYQRMMARRQPGSKRRARARHRCAKVSRKLACIRRNWSHQASRRIADRFGTVVLEDLDIPKMTRRGGAGRRLNRTVLASAWGRLRADLEYKAANFLLAPGAQTSRTCHECGEVSKKSRKSQSEFHCVACGHERNADFNAALNVLASGTGATARGEALPSGTSMIRELDLNAQGRPAAL